MDTATDKATGFSTALVPFGNPEERTTEPAGKVFSTPDQHRYHTLRRLGRGGMGIVERVQDGDLQRTVAMKILQGEHLANRPLVDAFVDEARRTARLEHPAIVPVHDCGRLLDGRLFFTMQEIKGRTLSDALVEATHTGHRRHLIDVLIAVSDAIAFAHSVGVVHRDLKPLNVMLGAFGVIHVVDWGASSDVNAQGFVTGLVAVAGTPGAMAPEQESRSPLQGVHTDVWALGLMLFEVLTGARPFVGEDQADEQQAPKMEVVGDLLDSDPLIQLCERALHHEWEQRPSAAEFAEELRAWVHGSRRMDRAMEALNDALAERDAFWETLDLADNLSKKARLLADGLDPLAPIDDKERVWRCEDACAEMVEKLEEDEQRFLRKVWHALSLAPDLTQAHQMLADHYQLQHHRAEAIGDVRLARRFEAELRTHDQTGIHQDYLAGRGRVELTLATPCHVRLFRGDWRRRRRVYNPHRDLGFTAKVALDLDMGPWLLEVQKGHHIFRVPAFVERCGVWQASLVVPDLDSLGVNDVFVPGGPFLAGDAAVFGPTPQWLWADSFVMRRYPVTNAEYLAFINDLVVQGQVGPAREHVPQQPGGPDGPGRALFQQNPDGTYGLATDAEGDNWHPNYPVTMINWFDACAYADWMAERTGWAWRLPTEFEWEKAARGVEGLAFPWGNVADANWMCMRQSHRGTPSPASIYDFPGDVSVYGVRGLGGNVRDLCLEPIGNKPLVDGNRVVAERAPDDHTSPRPYRGGHWWGLEEHCRSDYRAWNKPNIRNYSTGFRLVRPLVGVG